MATSTFANASRPNVWKVVAVAVTAGVAQTVWTPAAGKKFRLMGYSLSCTVATTMVLFDGATQVLRTGAVLAGTSIVSPPMGEGYASLAADNVLGIDVLNSGTVQGFVCGIEE